MRVEPAYPGREYVTSRRPRSSAASTYGANGRPDDGVPWCATNRTPSSGSRHTDIERTTAIDLHGELDDVHGVAAYAVIALTSASKLST